MDASEYEYLPAGVPLGILENLTVDQHRSQVFHRRANSLSTSSPTSAQFLTDERRSQWHAAALQIEHSPDLIGLSEPDRMLLLPLMLSPEQCSLRTRWQTKDSKTQIERWHA